MKKKAIVLDRDGVINKERGEYTFRALDFELNESLGQSLAELKARGYIFIIISNQSGIAKKIYDHADVLELHRITVNHLLSFEVVIENLFYCPHHPEFSGKCLCRKPGSLLYEKAIAKYNLDPNSSYIIGDKDRDIEPGIKLGFKTIKVEPNEPLKNILSLIA